MVAGAIAGNISAEATTPTGNTFAEAMRGPKTPCQIPNPREAGEPRSAQHGMVNRRRIHSRDQICGRFWLRYLLDASGVFSASRSACC